MVKYSNKRSKRVSHKKRYSKRRYSKRRYSKRRKYSKRRQKGGMENTGSYLTGVRSKVKQGFDDFNENRKRQKHINSMLELSRKHKNFVVKKPNDIQKKLRIAAKYGDLLKEWNGKYEPKFGVSVDNLVNDEDTLRKLMKGTVE